MSKPDITIINHQVALALAEDIGAGDITAQLIPAEHITKAYVICRDEAIICGLDWFDASLHQVDDRLTVEWQVKDGDQVVANTLLCQIAGPARSLLTAERTALNFLQTLSATATRTRQYVNAVQGTGCEILDTRKTIPGLRLAQKYAVTCGGGRNHRIGLFDAYLIKENHIIAAGSIAAAVKQARNLKPNVLLEVEVETLDELQQAFDQQVDRVLLDNFSLSMLQQAVALNIHDIQLEASGGVTLATIRDIAATGVNFISVGSLTKDLTSIDLSMRFQACRDHS